MKILISLFFILMSLSAFAVERDDLDRLLADKGSSIKALEAKGLELRFGEGSGAGFAMKYSNVEVIFIRDEAIFKRDIQNSQPLNVSSLSMLKSFQAGGRHILASDIIGVISK